MAYSMAKAIAAMVMIPTMTTSVTRKLDAVWIMKPRPRVAATSSAATSVDQPTLSPIRVPDQDLRQGVGQDHVAEHLQPVRPERPRRIDPLERHAPHARRGRQRDRRYDGEEDEEHLRPLADAEPDHHQRQVGERRDRPVGLDHRVEHAAEHRREAHAEPDRHRDEERAAERRQHPAEARPGMVEEGRIGEAALQRRDEAVRPPPPATAGRAAARSRNRPPATTPRSRRRSSRRR